MTQLFPDNFLWGASTAAYQIEGAAAVDGRGPSIWDVYSQIPGKIDNGDTGDIACDHYHRYSEDVSVMREIGLRGYRFSISWPRVMPTGRVAVNEKGLDFYDRLVDCLAGAGITPMVTLYHWDLPAALQMELGGWMNDDLPRHFTDYASLMFDRLGDRVKLWLTINEPWVVVDGGYFAGVHAPGIRNRAWGYRAGHNLLRAHAYAADLFRSKVPGGRIGFALNTNWMFPASEKAEDVAAADRHLMHMAGWFGDPVAFGDYPPVMREMLGDMLPVFTDQDSKLLKHSQDLIALNHYTSDVVCHKPGEGPMHTEVVEQNVDKSDMGWPIRPDGYYELLKWLHNRYGGLPIYITENGAAMPDEPDENGYVDDQDRISYLRDHFSTAAKAMKEGVNLAGYFVWSLMDNFEWSCGYSKRFGIVRCDYETQKRTIKASGRWYARVIETGELESSPGGR